MYILHYTISIFFLTPSMFGGVLKWEKLNSPVALGSENYNSRQI